ncbi:MAG: hypothetical protein KDD91_01155 [Caldilinea sp.]|nr:hypothetical protein [Caldilinea sp.]
MTTSTNPDLWKCPHCGQGPRDCRCASFTAFERAVLALLLAALLLWPSPAVAQCDPSCRDVPEPEIGLACTDLHPWSCDANQLYLPAVSR